MEGLSHGRLEARPGNYAPAADRVATNRPFTRPYLAYAAGRLCEVAGGRNAYCHLGRGFVGFSEDDGLGSTDGRSATLFARLRRL
jgi:hypothetical protein